jgi:hypothetical protein
MLSEIYQLYHNNQLTSETPGLGGWKPQQLDLGIGARTLHSC